MAKKAKTVEKTAKKKKMVKEDASEEHEETHSPDVKRLLEEYESKEGVLMEDDDFSASEQFDMDEEKN